MALTPLKILTAVWITALDPVPSGFIAASMMSPGVFGNDKEFKILRSVVRLDPISVVNVLPCFKITPKDSSHDNPVFKLEGISDPNGNVSIRSNKSPGELHARAAGHRAESSGSRTARLDVELSPAPFASWHNDLAIL